MQICPYNELGRQTSFARRDRRRGYRPTPEDIRRCREEMVAKRFPDLVARLDLDCWHRFETEEPTTFLGM